MIRAKDIRIKIALIATYFVVIGAFFSCKNEIAEVESLNNDTILPNQSVKDVDIKYSKKGKLAFRLQAPMLNQYGGDEAYNEMPLGVKIETYDSLDVVSSILTSNYAIQYSKSEIMEAKSDVIVINEKGEKLNTEHLMYLPKEDKIISDVFVKITTAEQVIMGEGLESNQDFTNYRIKKVKGVINIENDKVD